MKLNTLKPAAGAVREGWRRGQGPGSGNGKTAGRGHKGQHSRSGSKHRPGFEGGQMQLHRRLPKRGFHNLFRVEYCVINVDGLERAFSDGAEVKPEDARRTGLVRRDGRIKVLGNGELKKKLVVHAHKVSEQARKKIEAAGGKIEIIAVVSAPVVNKKKEAKKKK